MRSGTPVASCGHAHVRKPGAGSRLRPRSPRAFVAWQTWPGKLNDDLARENATSPSPTPRRCLHLLRCPLPPRSTRPSYRSRPPLRAAANLSVRSAQLPTWLLLAIRDTGTISRGVGYFVRPSRAIFSSLEFFFSIFFFADSFPGNRARTTFQNSSAPALHLFVVGGCPRVPSR